MKLITTIITFISCISIFAMEVEAATELPLVEYIEQLESDVKGRLCEWERFVSDVELISRDGDGADQDPHWYFTDIERRDWQDDDWQVSEDVVILANETDAELVNQITELSPKLEGTDKKSLTDIYQTTIRLEREIKEIAAKLVHKAKHNSQELRRTFEANFQTTKTDPKQALEAIGLKKGEYKTKTLEEIQEKWRMRFAEAEKATPEGLLGRQVWYAIQNVYQFDLYTKYIEENPDEAEDDEAELMTCLNSAFQFGATLRNLNGDIESACKSPRQAEEKSSFTSTRFWSKLKDVLKTGP
jgi:hypothetical protein